MICVWVSNYRPHPKDGEGNIFTGVCSSTSMGGGGTPNLGGVPNSQVRMGGPPFQVRTRWYPPSFLTGGTPNWLMGGGTSCQYACWDWMGVIPHIGGRYASCVHTGGLSCFSMVFTFFLTKLQTIKVSGCTIF